MNLLYKPTFSVFVATAILLAACAGGVPSEVTEYARSVLDQSPMCEGRDCRDIEVVLRTENEVSKTERLNGTEGNRCIGFEFATLRSDGSWRNEKIGYLIDKVDGNLNVSMTMKWSVWSMFCD